MKCLSAYEVETSTFPAEPASKKSRIVSGPTALPVVTMLMGCSIKECYGYEDTLAQGHPRNESEDTKIILI